MKAPMLRTRREFLCNCGIVTATAAMPSFLLHTARSVAGEQGWEAGSAAPLPGFKDDHVLVVVQLSGGNDGLNTLVPHADDRYHRARPQLRLKGDSLIPLTDELSINAGLEPMRELYENGKLTVVEGVGYPNPNRSHFRSMEIWQTAVDADRASSTGWIGRYFDAHCSGQAPPTAGVFVGSELPQAFDSRRGFGVAFDAPGKFGYVAGRKGDDTQSFRAINRPDAPASNDTLDFLRHVTDNAMTSSERILAVGERSRNAVDYPPDPLSRSLAVVARMIAGGLGSRIYYVAQGGYDTHANQLGTQNRLLRQYGAAVAAFQRDLEAQGQSRRVVTMTFSEFGRRVEENASRGTDHGTAAPMFLMGEPVAAGLKGARPSLSDLDHGDLKHTTDFRSVYASVLNQWFGVKPATVLGRAFPELNLIHRPA